MKYLKFDARKDVNIARFRCQADGLQMSGMFKGQKKATVSWRTPNRMNNKVTISTYTQFFNASRLPEKYFWTPSHRNTMSYAIVDEEWRQ